MNHPSASNPIQPFLRQQGFMILDGGLATELERRGFDLSDELWSARVLLEQPQAIRQLHLDYLTAGADCIISSSYQATATGFRKRGLSEAQAEEVLRRSLRLAMEARDEFWTEHRNRPGRLRPLVAASVGPYGAFLADGSEYSGEYGLNEQGLVGFHRRRWQILSEGGADLLACETIPSLPEARALLRLLLETPEIWAWLSFSCRDESHLSDGSRFADVVAEVQSQDRLLAVGVNCTPPRFIPGLIEQARRRTEKPLVVYPNSGEQWDAVRKRWQGSTEPVDFAAASREWRARGASLLGGCCRTGPEHIRLMRESLSERLPQAL